MPMGRVLAKPVSTLPTLPAYEKMLAAVAECVRIDEVATLRDQAAAISAYAAQARDTTLLVWAQEIRLRACLKLGALIHQIPRAEARGHGRYRLPPSGHTKAEMLHAARLNPGTALALQELVGGTDPMQQAAAKAAAEGYLGACRARRMAGTMSGLRRAVRGEAEAVPQRRARRPAAAAPATAPVAGASVPDVPSASPAPTVHVLGFAGLVRLIARTPQAVLPQLAVLAGNWADLAAIRAEAERAEEVISRWIAILCVVAPRHAVAAPMNAHKPPAQNFERL